MIAMLSKEGGIIVICKAEVINFTHFRGVKSRKGNVKKEFTFKKKRKEVPLNRRRRGIQRMAIE